MFISPTVTGAPGAEVANLGYCRRMVTLRSEVARGLRIAPVGDLAHGTGWCADDLGRDRMEFARACLAALARFDQPSASVAARMLEPLGDPVSVGDHGTMRRALQHILSLLQVLVQPEIEALPVPPLDRHEIPGVGDPELPAILASVERSAPASGATPDPQRVELAFELIGVAARLILYLFCLRDWEYAGGFGWAGTLRDAVLAIVRRHIQPDQPLTQRFDLDCVEAGVMAWCRSADEAGFATGPADRCTSPGRLREEARRRLASQLQALRLSEYFETQASEEQTEPPWDDVSHRPIRRHLDGRIGRWRQEDEAEVDDNWVGASLSGDAAPAEEESHSASPERGDDADGGEADDTRVDAPHLVVIPSIACPDTGYVRAFVESLRSGGVLGEPLPLVTCPDPALSCRRLQAAFPHWASVIGELFHEAAGGISFQIHPTLLVGLPGIGKTELARALGRELGLAATVVSCSASHDGAFGGTSRGWATATPSAPVLAVLEQRIGNPLIVLDELEKAGGSRSNGSLYQVLLGMLDQADAWTDPMLLAPVNLAHFNWLATANTSDRLPAPLRDRFRILRLDPPRPEHAPALIPVLLDAMREGRDRDWIMPLSPEEQAAVQAVWRDGSVRSLRRYVKGVLTARDAAATRH